ncbi:hypothetical protein C5167_028018 [Papaver somniferum]|nr:hypothetical protein C5167_028018 [Papaver somniferum]
MPRTITHGERVAQQKNSDVSLWLAIFLHFGEGIGWELPSILRVNLLSCCIQSQPFASLQVTSISFRQKD